MTQLLGSSARTCLPLQRLRAEAVEGPDRGRACTGVSESLGVGTARANELVLTDPTVSRFHVDLIGQDAGVLVSDCGSSNGTYLGAVRIDRGVVPPGTVLRLGRTAVRVSSAAEAAVDLHAGDSLGGLVGRSEVMRRLMAQIELVAQSEAAVLIVGESGTGKELVAHALHAAGRRASGPFMTVDCGALPATLTNAELFGHERGAFTGADRQRAGAFELAHGGTLFLDELGEVAPAVQPSLLGALERGRFRRLGGQKELEMDVRLVSATQRDLRQHVNCGAFRLDLYYRVAVVVLKVPPLRERREDIPRLVERLLADLGFQGPVGEVFSPTAMAALSDHPWPGNVRELRNLVEATLATGEAPTPVRATTDTEGDLLHLPYHEARGQLLSQFERRYLERVLAETGGNLSRAARVAQVHRSHLFDLVRRHKLR